MQPTVEERVKLGIIVLDRFAPSNWRNLIDLNKLDIFDLRNCVLGQVFGNFGKGVEIISDYILETNHNLMTLGFALSVYNPSDIFNDNIRLIEEWKKQLTSGG